MNIAGVIKDWMLIFFSFYLFHAPVTALNLAGYAFCCSGALPSSHAPVVWQHRECGPRQCLAVRQSKH